MSGRRTLLLEPSLGRGAAVGGVKAPVVKSVELPSGIRLPYAEQGDVRGVPVVLLHGVTDSWRSFEPVLPHLPDAIRALALTQRGHGDADRPEHYPDLSSQLGEISAPTLILWGDRDAICPSSEQHALAAAIAWARLVVWSGAGHALHWEEPEHFAADLVAFIEDCVD